MFSLCLDINLIKDIKGSVKNKIRSMVNKLLAQFLNFIPNSFDDLKTIEEIPNRIVAKK